MASDRKSVAAEGRDFGNVIGQWLDPFAQSETQATVDASAGTDTAIPFSEWCVIPVALAFVIGEMLYQFTR